MTNWRKCQACGSDMFITLGASYLFILPSYSSLSHRLSFHLFPFFPCNVSPPFIPISIFCSFLFAFSSTLYILAVNLFSCLPLSSTTLSHFLSVSCSPFHLQGLSPPSISCLFNSSPLTHHPSFPYLFLISPFHSPTPFSLHLPVPLSPLSFTTPLFSFNNMYFNSLYHLPPFFLHQFHFLPFILHPSFSFTCLFLMSLFHSPPLFYSYITVSHFPLSFTTPLFSLPACSSFPPFIHYPSFFLYQYRSFPLSFTVSSFFLHQSVPHLPLSFTTPLFSFTYLFPISPFYSPPLFFPKPVCFLFPISFTTPFCYKSAFHSRLSFTTPLFSFVYVPHFALPFTNTLFPSPISSSFPLQFTTHFPFIYQFLFSLFYSPPLFFPSPLCFSFPLFIHHPSFFLHLPCF